MTSKTRTLASLLITNLEQASILHVQTSNARAGPYLPVGTLKYVGPSGLGGEVVSFSGTVQVGYDFTQS